MTNWERNVLGLSVRFASATVNEDEQYAEIATNIIPQVTTVRLYEETIKHANDHHGDQLPVTLPSVIDAVAQTIQAPTHVEQSYKNSYVFVNAGATNASGAPLRVPVKVQSGTSGLVKTYFCSSTENEPIIVYRQTDETE